MKIVPVKHHHADNLCTPLMGQKEACCDEIMPLMTSPFSSSEKNVGRTTTIRLTSSSSRAGLGITEKHVKNTSKTVVIVKFVLDDGLAVSHNIQPGMIILGYVEMKSIVERMKRGPFPFDLRFYNPLPSEADEIDLGVVNKGTISRQLKISGNYAADERRKIVTGFVSSSFVIIHSFLFGWIDKLKKDDLKGKPCWCKDLDSSLVASALSREMVKKVDEGQFHEALNVANEALTVQRRCEGSNNPDIGRILNFIGIILTQIDEDSHNYMALTSFEESLTIMQETLGYGDEETSFALHNMWLLLHNERERQKEFEEERNEVFTYKGALPIQA